ncbi:MAG: hypothetical protein HW416_3819, partial [Chloroflexi bacterium]|nr:hypothetical protein [Chloroflexota bacterium]
MASNGSPIALPENHLAAVIEDALVAADGSSRASARATRERGFVAAVIYGWAVGASGSRDLAARAQIDPGLQFLFRGAATDFSAIRNFREGHANDIEVACANALVVCRTAGMLRLGQIRLDPRGPGRADRTESGAFSADDFRAAARELLSGSTLADQRDDQDFGEEQPAHIPVELASRANRQLAFTGAGAVSAQRARHVTIRRPGLPWIRASRSGVPSMIGAFTLLLAGLLLVRWVSALGAPPATGASARPAVSVPGGFVPIVPTPVLAPTLLEDDLAEARDEAMRLAEVALDDDDLVAARDWYFLAAQAETEDGEAERRLRMVETALGINDRRGGWITAVDELYDLQRLAPDSPTVLSAYVTSLVGAGREALALGDLSRAVDLCGEATRWLPGRADAQTCLALAQPPQSPVPTPAVQPTVGTAVPTVLPTATIRPAATPLAAPFPGEVTMTVTPTEPSPTAAETTGASPPAAPSAVFSPTAAPPTPVLPTAVPPT